MLLLLNKKLVMEEKLISSLAEALEMESSEINMADTFRDYEEYSSISELSVIAMLDTEFGIEIEMEEFNKYKTVADLARLVKERSK